MVSIEERRSPHRQGCVAFRPMADRKIPDHGDTEITGAFFQHLNPAEAGALIVIFTAAEAAKTNAAKGSMAWTPVLWNSSISTAASLQPNGAASQTCLRNWRS